jgi:hypothetical protein
MPNAIRGSARDPILMPKCFLSSLELEPAMVELGEHHKRRILVTFQRVDELLNQSLQLLTQSQSGSRSRHIQDISPSKIPRIESHIQLIRQTIGSFLERLQIALPERLLPLSWVVKTNLTSIDITLEDLYPQKMKGYGDMGSAAAHELTQTLNEIQRLMRQISKALE